MKATTALLSLIAAGTGALLTSCVDPYYTGPTTATATIYRPGYVVQTLPPSHRVEVIAGTRYYYHDNVYYRPQGRGYVVVESPHRHRHDYDGRRDYDRDRDWDRGPSRGRGEVTVIRELPRGYRVVTHGGQRYYRVGDVYYRSEGGGYVVVRSPF